MASGNTSTVESGFPCTGESENTSATESGFTSHAESENTIILYYRSKNADDKS
ncbi:hypothetical protein ES703_65837 [subsurface metagenome]